MWSRPHLRDAVASNDSVGRPDGWELVIAFNHVYFHNADLCTLQTDDLFWVVILASRPSLLTISTSPPECPPDGAERRTYNLVTPGIHKFSHRMVAGTSMWAEMIRDGECVARCDAGTLGFKFESHPKTYNFNAFTCKS